MTGLARSSYLGCVVLELRLGLSPQIGLARSCLEHHSFFVAAFVDGEAVFVDGAVFEQNILTADPAEFGVLVCRQHDVTHFERLKIGAD
jgi:hypothetical protein